MSRWVNADEVYCPVTLGHCFPVLSNTLQIGPTAYTESKGSTAEQGNLTATVLASSPAQLECDRAEH